MTTFGKLKNGELFFVSGSEYVKVSKQGAIRISPLVCHFEGGEQVAKSKHESTTVGNWRYGWKKLEDVRGG